MNRRHLLQVLGLGPLMPFWSRVMDGLSIALVPSMVTAKPTTEDTPAPPSPESIDLDALKFCSLCIGLGPEAETLLAALRARDRADLAVDALLIQSGTDPAVLAAWSSDIQPSPDVIVLAIDARDRQARDTSRFWAARLAEVGYARTALVIGDDQPNADRSWRRELSAHFDGVIDLCPQRTILRTAATRALTMGLLFLNRSIVCYDASDVRNILRLGAQSRSAATVWNRPNRRRIAFQRLWHELQPGQIQGAIAFLHGGLDLSPDDFNRVIDQLGDRLPDDAYRMTTLFPHPDWPAGRRVLELTLVGDWFDAPLATAPGWAAGLRQELAAMTDDEESHVASDAKDLEDLNLDIPAFLRQLQA